MYVDHESGMLLTSPLGCTDITFDIWCFLFIDIMDNVNVNTALMLTDWAVDHWQDAID